ncbi:AraC family transcriptional regulator [Shewanella sp. BC20]|uniref:helix-turn-helix transcriptional regulator n=1 Tax=unclassified Shewanella TaxID=196818 RepID=UPI00005DDA73|nr:MULTISPECIES: AraC family transcriptional regulator [unclassified Shewanella]ABK50086.1 transcriptional regulator, AraC family [Shewanella sp. ANA-3]PWF62641.1 AraC family transcriptional regulator [Shewanella sp. BC20]
MIRMFEYDSKLAQSLSRVPVHQPSIIRVIQGEKSLLWQDDALAVNAEQLLLLPAGSHISFVNRPMSGRYRAVQLLLPYELPSGVMLAATDRQIPKPTQTISRSVDFAWNALLHSLTLALPTSVQMHYLAALLLSLPQQASVNWLYSHKPANVSQAVLGLLGQHPSAPWQQEDIADKLHMSSASLRRKLAQEDTSFRQLLAEVRLCQGLTLLQNSTDSVLQIALACGYLSAEKFSARFKQAFGLTPAAYRRTL